VLLDGKGPIANKEGIAYYNRLIDALLENGTSLYQAPYLIFGSNA
jgi:beta-glucosidase/6-phospho-beta-glucosidase/beta-galactosidase